MWSRPSVWWWLKQTQSERHSTTSENIDYTSTSTLHCFNQLETVFREYTSRVSVTELVPDQTGNTSTPMCCYHVCIRFLRNRWSLTRGLVWCRSKDYARCYVTGKLTAAPQTQSKPHDVLYLFSISFVNHATIMWSWHWFLSQNSFHSYFLTSAPNKAWNHWDL